MQNSAAPSLNMVLLAISAIASFLGIPSTAVLTHFLTRRMYSAGIHKTNAEARQADAVTGKTEAETRQIDSTILFKAYERLDDLEVINHEQGLRITALEQENAKVNWELGLSQQREKIHVEELALANAELRMLRGPQQPFSEISSS